MGMTMDKKGLRNAWVKHWEWLLFDIETGKIYGGDVLKPVANEHHGTICCGTVSDYRWAVTRSQYPIEQKIVTAGNWYDSCDFSKLLGIANVDDV